MLTALLLVAASSTPAFPPQGTYSYAASMSGQPVGTWSVAVKSIPSGTEIDESSAASLAGIALSAQAALVLGSDLSPARYDGHYTTPGQSPSVNVSLTGTSATVVGLTMQPKQVSLGANTHHFVVIEPGLLAGLFVLPAQLGAWNETAVTWITPTSAQTQVLTASPNAQEPRPQGVASRDALLSIAQPIAVTIWYDPSTLVPDRIAVPSQGAVLTRIH
jgi:hypothetical protein